ncbi:MAG: carboxymuconolactone decarboxylase family protein [Dongiaceae bacterium]
MKERMNYIKAAPDAYKTMLKLQDYVATCGLEFSLLELVKMRASQINGCAYCLKLHTVDARKAGESEERIYLLSAWREAPLYTPREQAALAWTEALTLIAETGAPDDAYEQARREFSEEEMMKLTMAIVVINGWNRIAIGFRSVPEVEGKVNG